MTHVQCIKFSVITTNQRNTTSHFSSCSYEKCLSSLLCALRAPKIQLIDITVRVKINISAFLLIPPRTVITSDALMHQSEFNFAGAATFCVNRFSFFFFYFCFFPSIIALSRFLSSFCFFSFSLFSKYSNISTLERCFEGISAHVFFWFAKIWDLLQDKLIYFQRWMWMVGAEVVTRRQYYFLGQQWMLKLLELSLRGRRGFIGTPLL